MQVRVMTKDHPNHCNLSLLSKSSEVGHSRFGRFRRFWWVDHCLELVVADPPISILIFLLVIDDDDDSGDDNDDDFLTTWSAYVNISSISTSLT